MSDRAPIGERHRWRYPAALIAAGAIALACTEANAQAAAKRSFGNPAADAQGPCPAAVDARTPLSLPQAVDLALCNNPDVAVAWASIRAQAAAVGEARSAYWPELSVSASELNERTGYPETAEPAGNTTGKTIYGSLDWRLFDFGGRSSRYRAAESLLTAALATRDATIQQVLGALIQAYFDAITAKAVVIDSIESESVASASLHSARRRMAAGNADHNDVLQATAALERARLDHNRAEADDEKAIAVLAYSLGLPAGGTIPLPDSVNARSSTQESDLTAWLHATERRHPAIVAARAAVQAARDEVASARSADRPTGRRSI
jgi:outer membrane protein